MKKENYKAELVETFIVENECKPTEYELSELMKKRIAKDKEVRRYKAMDALEKMGYNGKEITDVLSIIKSIFINDETLTGADVKKTLDTFRYLYVIWNS